MSTSDEFDQRTAGSGRYAWMAVLFAVWITGGIFLLGYALGRGDLRDSVVSAYHLLLYSGVLALAATCLLLAVRTVRAGRPWQAAFPPGYGLLVGGVVVLLAWPIIEIGWRQGVGIGGDQADQFFAPSRLLLFGGCLLVAVAPLRAAQLGPTGSAGRWPPVISAAVVLWILGVIGIQPAQTPWLEAAPSYPVARSEIWVMNADGSGQTRLIVPPEGFEIGNAVWSADGSQIAFTRNKTPPHQGELATDIGIWIAAADGTNQRELISGTGWYWLPHWSPDSQWITFTIDAQHGPGSGAGVLPPEGAYGQAPAGGQPPAVTPNVDVWRIRADGSGGPQLLLTDPAEDRAAVYSPDGRYLLFDSTRSAGRTGLYTAGPDGSNPTELTALGDDWGGAWSPDMTRVAFNSSPTGAAYDIYVTSFPRAGAPIRLTDDQVGSVAPQWSPDGRRIAFASQRVDGKNDIWSMAADGSDQVNLTASTGAAEGMTSGGQGWGIDGRILYMRSQDPPAGASPLVRKNLGITEMLLGALILSLLVIVVIRIGARFGAITLIMTVATVGVVVPNGEWRFVPAAIVGGLLVDVAIRLAPDNRRQLAGAVGAALAFVLAPGGTVMVTSVIGWPPGLLIGVALAAAFLAAGAAVLIGPQKVELAADGTG